MNSITLNKSANPFKYTVRVSARVRNVRLAVKPYAGLEVVIPSRFPRKQIPGILQQHAAWITSQLEKLSGSLQQPELPPSITIALTNQHFSLDYQPAIRGALLQHGDQLSIQYQDQQQAIDLLRQWVRNQAISLLSPRLEALAREFSFNFKRTSVRSQKSRWGSCSSSGTISLNDQLIFLPEPAVRYLMIHELCHTRHMNHSPAFWQLVAHCCPEYRIQEKVLSKGRERVPQWFLKNLFSRS
ncbi:MAG: M48 family metallopeptidase [Gammaproteobacteria bacterium]|nr:M48 family metallopeptidase [Gammaproteobacteria bacterium]